ncbi:hypothetical protein [Thiosocius teredinicola]|uniref:hypothetical protein n=1 Tax=Thiosocius teredinicola TaxID=1973002 RepID=UPI000F7A8380
MSLSFTWSKSSENVAHFGMMVGERSWEFEGTDAIDSLGEFAEVTSSTVLEGREAKVAFENEPGQHLLGMAPLGDGRVEIKLVWVAIPYAVLGGQAQEEVLAIFEVSVAELLGAVRSMLAEVQKHCGAAGRTLGKYPFPEAAFERLKNA